jgi:hypothetical protein
MCETVELTVKNITLAIEDEVVAEVRKYAVANNTTVNGLVREYFSRIATFESRAAKTRQELLELSETSEGRLEEGWKWNRQELYDRPVLSRHERPSLRSAGPGSGGDEKKKGG